jgi:hypothetical protein
MDVKRALLLGTSSSAVPIYKALSRLGLEIFPIGSYRSDPLTTVSNWIEEDYSDDRKVESLARRFDCDFIVPSCNDTAFVTATKVAKTCQFPGFDMKRDLNQLWDKWGYREILRGSKYEVLSFMDWNDRLDTSDIASKFLRKPRFSHSGIGVSEVTDFTEPKNPSEDYFYETFLEGTLHSHSIFLANSKIVADFIADEFCSHFDFAVSNSNIPSRLDEQQKSQVREMSIFIAESLGVHTGLLHTQFISSKRGVYPLESMRRCPGDFFGSMVEKATGYDFYRNYVAGFTEIEIDSYKEGAQIKPIGRVSLYADTSGLIEMEELSLRKTVKSYHFSLLRVGDPIKREVSNKSSVVLLETSNEKDLWEVIPEAKVSRATLHTVVPSE